MTGLRGRKRPVKRPFRVAQTSTTLRNEGSQARKRHSGRPGLRPTPLTLAQTSGRAGASRLYGRYHFTAYPFEIVGGRCLPAALACEPGCPVRPEPGGADHFSSPLHEEKILIQGMAEPLQKPLVLARLRKRARPGSRDKPSQRSARLARAFVFSGKPNSKWRRKVSTDSAIRQTKRPGACG